MLCDRHQRQRLPPSCSCRRDWDEATGRCVWTLRTPPIWSHSPQCAECDHVGGRVWVGRVRRPASSQFCGIERGRFRRMPDGDHRTRRATSQPHSERFSVFTRSYLHHRHVYTTRRSRKKYGPPKNTPEKTHNRISAAPRGSDNMDTIQSPRIDEGIRACIHPGCHDLIVHQAHRPRIFFTRPRRGGTRRSSAWARRSRRGSAPAQVNGGRKPPLLLMGPPPTARRAPRRQPRSRARCPR